MDLYSFKIRKENITVENTPPPLFANKINYANKTMNISKNIKFKGENRIIRIIQQHFFLIYFSNSVGNDWFTFVVIRLNSFCMVLIALSPWPRCIRCYNSGDVNNIRMGEIVFKHAMMIYFKSFKASDIDYKMT